MCIAIVNKKGTLPKAQISNSWSNNYHGAGFCYIKEDGTFHTYHNDKSADAFYKSYKKHREQNQDSVFLLHFRISTHGTVTKDNLHPFIINDNVALIHNGMVDLNGHTYSDKRSDTRYLCEEILAKMPDGWHNSIGVHKLIDQVGGWSKFVLLGTDGALHIINEKSGHWVGDNWYSNNSYEKVNSYVDYGGKKMTKGSTTSTNAWDDDYQYPVQSSTYKVEKTSCVPYLKQKSLEDYMKVRGLVNQSRFFFSPQVLQEDVDLFTELSEHDHSTKDIENDIWYSIEEKGWYFMSVEVQGMYYTVLSLDGKNGHGSVMTFNFAVHSNKAATMLLNAFNSQKISAKEKLSEAAINAEDLLWDILQKQENEYLTK